MRLQRTLISFFFCILTLCEAKPPSLTPRDTRVKVEEILKAHVSYQKLTPDIIRRTFENYLEEVDPAKLYFIESDLLKWIDPSDTLLQRTLEGYRQEDFTPFLEMHEVLISAIERREKLEKKNSKIALPEGVQTSEFKNLEWTKSEGDLASRLIRLKALQIETAEKIPQITREQFLQRIDKRRLKREEELIAHSEKERMQMVLSLVLKATSSALDSQTAYFTPAEANQFMIQVQQRLFGIGTQLRDDLNGFTIVRLLEGGPASTGGKLKIGDRIIAVNGEPVIGMEIMEAVELIRGQQGSAVLLTISRDIEEEGNKREITLDLEIVRGEVVLKESRLESSSEPYGQGAIAILHLFSFYQDSTTSSAEDLRSAIEELKAQHDLEGVILDLRNNAGGFLPQAVSVTGLFIQKGVVVSVKDNTGAVQRLRNIDEKIAWEGPLLVLTNRTSASAAEIVAQTLQDYGRALVVGDEETYGKGTFQTFTLEAAHYGKVNPKGEYKVTRGRYYTVSGKSPQLIGVKADIVVPGVFSRMEIGEKFSKFPLENETLPPSFEDDLSDIPSSHRNQIQRLYKFNLQPILTTYSSLLPLLRNNSAERLKANKNYANFLNEIEKKELIDDSSTVFGQADLQLVEAVNIMKDLILLKSR